MPRDASWRITLDDLLRLSRPGEIAVAPDGRAIAFALHQADLAQSELRTELYVTPDPEADDDAPGQRQLTHAMHDAQDPQWSPDGRFLAFVTFRPQPHETDDDDRREDGGDKQQVFLLPAHGGDARRLTECPEGVDRYVWWPDGSGVVTLGPGPRPESERSWRRRRDDARDDGIVVLGEIPEQEIWFHPLRGRPRKLAAELRGVDDLDVSPCGRYLAYATNHTGLPEDHEKYEVILLDLETGRTRRATGGRGGAEGGPRFAADGRHLFIEAWSDPARPMSRQDVLAVDLNDPDAPPRLLLASVDRDVEAYAPAPDGRLVAAVADGLESRLVVVDPATGETESIALGGAVVTALDVARARGTIAVAYERSDRGPEVGIVHRERRRIERMTDLNPLDERYRLARRRRIRWTHEGLDHEGLLLLPPDPPPPGRRYPLLVWIHGGPHWRVTDTFSLYEAEAFAARGWAVFAPQYRGSSGAGEAYSLANYRDLGGGDARDVVAGIDAAIAEGEADPDRLAVAGASYGAYLTCWLLATTKRFRAGVALAGVFDLSQDYLTSEWFTWETNYLGARPWEDPELYRERSPIHRVADLDAPLLLLHGARDDNTPLGNARALHRALRDLGRTTELVIYPREGHGLAEPAHRRDALLRTIDWLDRHVRGGRGVHVPGRRVGADRLELVPLGHQVRRDYAGVRPLEGRMFVEVTVLLRAREGGPERLALTPAGGASDLTLVDPDGDRYRPVGVPIDVHGQTVLLEGRGAVSAAASDDGRPPSLPVAAVFELPERPATYELHVAGLPAVVLEIAPDEEDGGDDPGDDAAPGVERETRAPAAGVGEASGRSPADEGS